MKLYVTILRNKPSKSYVTYVSIIFKVKYTVHGMRKWLQRHGFCYKKPALVPGKTNKEQQRAWIAEYEKLRATLPGDETICFADGVHPTHNVQSAYGWIKKMNLKGQYLGSFICYHLL